MWAIVVGWYKKMKELVAFEAELNVDDSEKGLKLISENFSMIEEIKSWVKDYSNNQDSYIKTAAIETITLLEAKEADLKMIETGVKTNRNTPGEEAKETIEKQIYHTERYANAMQLLLGS